MIVTLRIGQLRIALDETTIIPIAASLLLVAIWFRGGHMLAWAENGIPFYNPARDFFMTSTAWYEYQLGSIAPTTVASSPFYFVLSLFQHLGIPAVVLEMATLALFLAIQGTSASLLSQELFSQKSRILGVSSGLFYMLNPLSMSIWHEFRLTYFFAYSAIPLLFYVFVKLLKTEKHSYAVYFAFITVVFSYGLVSPGFILPLWFVLLIYTIYFVVHNHSLKYSLFAIRSFATVAILWFALNAWWLIQLLPSAQQQFVQGFSSSVSGDLETLNAISIGYHATPDYLIRLMYWFYTNSTDVTWGWFYSNEAVVVLELLPLALGLVALLFGKRRPAIFSFVLLGIVIFFSKGSAPPFPDLFLWLFTNFQVFRVFRNPVETFGTFIPLAYAPLVGMGVLSLRDTLKRFFSRYCSSPERCRLPDGIGKGIALPLLLIMVTVNVFPMWTGAVFTTSHYTPTNNPSIGYSVQVPSYYSDINAKMAGTPGTYRIITLPLDGGGITYSWEYGYNGGDINGELYNFPALSESLSYSLFGTPYLTSSINGVAVSDPVNFWKLASITNSRFVVVRGDVNASDRSLIDPSAILTRFTGAYSPSVTGGLVEQNSTQVSRIPVTDKSVVMAQADIANFTYTLGISHQNLIQGDQIIEAKAYPSYGNIGAWVYLPTNMSNTASQQYLEIWIRGNESGLLFAMMSDSKMHSETWDGRLNPNYAVDANTWKLFVLPLDVPSETNINTPGPVNRSSISSLLIGLTNQKHVPTDLQIGGIYLDKGIFSGSVRNLNFVGSFGKLSLFELSSSVFLPRVYAVANFTRIDALDTFISNMSQFEPADSVVVLSSEFQRHSYVPNPESMLKPSLIFSMKSPSLYEVKVNATHPFMLVLSETYNPGWTVSAPWGTVQADDHFVVNGFANMWYIDHSGNYTLQIYFGPNLLLTYGTWISVVTSVVVLLLVFRRRLTGFFRVLQPVFLAVSHKPSTRS